MSARNRLALLLTLISLGLLLPGLTQPILTISAKISLLGNEREIFRETQSILQSVQRLRDSGNHLVAGLILLFSILVSSSAQLGDLFESLLKRWAGVKDAGVFLPGHGGVLDRIDSMIVALPMTYFFVSLVILR